MGAFRAIDSESIGRAAELRSARTAEDESVCGFPKNVSFFVEKERKRRYNVEVEYLHCLN